MDLEPPLQQLRRGNPPLRAQAVAASSGAAPSETIGDVSGTCSGGAGCHTTRSSPSGPDATPHAAYFPLRSGPSAGSGTPVADGSIVREPRPAWTCVKEAERPLLDALCPTRGADFWRDGHPAVRGDTGPYLCAVARARPA